MIVRGDPAGITEFLYKFQYSAKYITPVDTTCRRVFLSLVFYE
jgi:hypothetical protein